MKIGMFNPCFAYMRGGGETATRNIATGLRKLGYDVTILCYKSFFIKPAPPGNEIPIEYIPSLWELRELSRILPGKLGGGTYRLQLEFYKFFIRFHIDKWDIIHDQSHEAMEIGVKKNKNVILTLQGIPPIRLKNYLSQCRYIVSPAHSIRRILENEWHLKNVVYIPHAIDLERFKKRDKQESRMKVGIDGFPIVLFVGRLIQAKNLPTLIKAFKIILRTYPDAKLYIVGHGILKMVLKKLLSKLAIDRNVRFVGKVSDEELPYYYNACDIYVQPSVIDFIPYSTLEAIASGCKLVVSDKVIDTIEMFPQIGVAKATSPDSMADKIIEILKDGHPEIPASQIQEYSIDNVAKKYANLYEKM